MTKLVRVKKKKRNDGKGQDRERIFSETVKSKKTSATAIVSFSIPASFSCGFIIFIFVFIEQDANHKRFPAREGLFIFVFLFLELADFLHNAKRLLLPALGISFIYIYVSVSSHSK